MELNRIVSYSSVCEYTNTLRTKWVVAVKWFDCVYLSEIGKHDVGRTLEVIARRNLWRVLVGVAQQAHGI